MERAEAVNFLTDWYKTGGAFETMSDKFRLALRTVLTAPTKAFVVMGNNYPHSVWSTKELAEVEIARLKAAVAARKGTPIYWLHYEFTLNKP